MIRTALLKQIEELKKENAKLKENAEYSDVVKDGFLYIYKRNKLVGVTHLVTLERTFTNKVGYA